MSQEKSAVDCTLECIEQIKQKFDFSKAHYQAPFLKVHPERFLEKIGVDTIQWMHIGPTGFNYLFNRVSEFLAMELEIAECQNMPYRLFCERYWMSEDILSLRDREIALLGLGGECGEVLEIFKKRTRGDVGDHVSSEKLILELGDMYYYLNIICAQNCLDFHLNENDYKRALVGADTMNLGLHLFIKASMIVRNVQFFNTLILKPGSWYEVGDTMAWIGAILFIEKSSIEEMCKANVRKLVTRLHNNGTLRGSGSDR